MPPRRLQNILNKKRFWGEIWKHRFPYLFIAPFFIIYTLFMGFPVVFSLYLSFCKWNGNPSTPIRWIGLGNYIRLFHDKVFLISLRNMLVYVPSAVFLGISIALLLALALNVSIRFRGFFRACFFLPSITSMVVISLVWMQIYNLEPRIGLINGILQHLGKAPVGWLSDPHISLLSIIIMVTWASAGYNAVLFLAGLQGISQELYEAAEIDGANMWQKFWHITVPMIRPTTTFIIIMGFIYGLQIFEPMQIMTSGGPAYSTMSMVLLLYNNAFSYFYWGYASALAYVLFILIMVFTFLYFYARKKMGQSFFEV